MSIPFYFPYIPFPSNPQQNSGQSQDLLVYIQDEKIYKKTPDGAQVIGVTSKAHDELQADYDSIYSRCQEYYDALVEAKIITPEPTQEELLKRQAEQLENASRIIAESAENQREFKNILSALQQEITELKQQGLTGRIQQESKDYEHNPVNSESASSVTAMERQNQDGLGNCSEIPEYEKRSVSGDGRPQYKHATAPTGASLPPRRAGSKHS